MTPIFTWMGSEILEVLPLLDSNSSLSIRNKESPHLNSEPPCLHGVVANPAGSHAYDHGATPLSVCWFGGVGNTNSQG